MDGDSDRQRTERTTCKSIKCGSVYHIIAKCQKKPKDIEKQQNQVCFDYSGNRASQK